MEPTGRCVACCSHGHSQSCYVERYSFFMHLFCFTSNVHDWPVESGREPIKPIVSATYICIIIVKYFPLWTVQYLWWVTVWVCAIYATLWLVSAEFTQEGREESTCLFLSSVYWLESIRLECQNVSEFTSVFIYLVTMRVNSHPTLVPSVQTKT